MEERLTVEEIRTHMKYIYDEMLEYVIIHDGELDISYMYTYIKYYRMYYKRVYGYEITNFMLLDKIMEIGIELGKDATEYKFKE